MLNDLISQGFLRECDCNICFLFFSRGSPLRILRVSDSNYYIRSFSDNSCNYWLGCPRHIDSSPVTFDEMLDGLGTSDQDFILFNITNFKSD
jgi:hypothetical protein